MDTWNKVGVVAAVIGTVVVILQFFGVQPTGAVKGVPVNTIAIAIMMALTWGAVFFGWQSQKKRVCTTAQPSATTQPENKPTEQARVTTVIGRPDRLIHYADWARPFLRQTCERKEHTGRLQLNLAMHRGCTFRDCDMEWDGYVSVMSDCHFVGTNTVHVEARRFRDAVQFFWNNAHIGERVVLQPSED